MQPTRHCMQPTRAQRLVDMMNAAKPKELLPGEPGYEEGEEEDEWGE